MSEVELPDAWRRWDDVADIFTGQAGGEWTRDRGALDDSLGDPWTGR